MFKPVQFVSDFVMQNIDARIDDESGAEGQQIKQLPRLQMMRKIKNEAPEEERADACMRASLEIEEINENREADEVSQEEIHYIDIPRISKRDISATFYFKIYERLYEELDEIEEQVNNFNINASEEVETEEVFEEAEMQIFKNRWSYSKNLKEIYSEELELIRQQAEALGDLESDEEVNTVPFSSTYIIEQLGEILTEEQLLELLESVNRQMIENLRDDRIRDMMRDKDYFRYKYPW